TSARPIAMRDVEPHSTRPTTHGIRTAAVAIRIQVMEKESPDERLTPSHHIKGNKSRGSIKNATKYFQAKLLSEEILTCRRRGRRLPSRAGLRGFRRNGVHAFEI